MTKINPLRIFSKTERSKEYVLPAREMKIVQSEITLQMLRRVRIFTAIAFLIHLFIVLFVVPGNMKIYKGDTLTSYTYLLFADISVITGSLIFFILATVFNPRTPDRVKGIHRAVVIGTCLFLMLWAAVKTGFQQAFTGQISIYLVILLTMAAGALINLRSSLIVFGIPLAAFITGSFIFCRSGPLLQDNLINGSSLTLVSWFLSRMLYKNYLGNLVKQRIIERQKNDLQKERNELQKSYSLLEAELSLARKIQDILIPHSSPMPGVASLYKPMHQVGGDFFDYITFRDSNELGIFLSDVSGHGVPAAFITAMIKSFILQSRKESGDPATLFRLLNDHLFQHTNKNFITAFYGILNAKNRTFRYTNAGHCRPIIVDSRGSRYIDIPASGFPLAIMSQEDMMSAGKDFMNNEIVLEKGSKLVLYTDGLTEASAHSDPGSDFESGMINTGLAELVNLPSSEFIESVYQRLVTFHGGELFEDDICMICIDV